MKSALPARLLFLLGGCTGAVAPPPQPLPDPVSEVVAPEPEPFPFAAVWTALPGVFIAEDAGNVTSVPNLFTRLDVVRRDTSGLRVRCLLCERPIEGYVREDQIVYEPTSPAEAAREDLADFALAIREAARSRDLPALRAVMAADFSFSFIGPQNPDVALAVWSTEQFRTLDQVPALLDRGLVTPDDWIWSAPPAFVTDLWYHGVRLGFRRQADERWEWIYLLRGIEMAASAATEDGATPRVRAGPLDELGPERHAPRNGGRAVAPILYLEVKSLCP